MLIFGDAEYTGLHQQTTLISIGLVSQDGKTFYAELNDYDTQQINPWLNENVIKRLKFQAPTEGEDEPYIASRHQDNPVGNDLYTSYSVEMRGNKQQVRKELLRWLAQFSSVEWVFDVGAYDFVLLVDLLSGNALDLPIWVSPTYYDLAQALAIHYDCDMFAAFDMSRERLLKLFEVEMEEDKHNALYDAKVIKELFNVIHD